MFVVCFVVLQSKGKWKKEAERKKRVGKEGEGVCGEREEEEGEKKGE